MVSWQLWIVTVIAHLLEKSLFGSLLQLSFFLLLSIPLSKLLLLLLLLFAIFFTSALVDGHSMESERQQISSSLPDSSHNFGRPPQCCSFNDLCSFSDFQLFQPPFQVLGIVLISLISIGITVILRSIAFFFSSVIRSKYLSLHFLWFSISGPLWRQCSLFGWFSFFFFFLLTISSPVLLVGIRWSVCISKSQRSLCISFSKTNFVLCIYHLVLWSIYSFLHSSLWITFPTQLCLVLYFFVLLCCIRFIILFRSPHNLKLLFCWVLSIFALTLLVLMTLFCAAIWKDSNIFM